VSRWGKYRTRGKKICSKPHGEATSNRGVQKGEKKRANEGRRRTAHGRRGSHVAITVAGPRKRETRTVKST